MKEGPSNLVPLRALPAEPALAGGDDEQLMTLAAAGNKSAFAVLVTRYLPKVTQFCRKFVGERSAAQELAQEIFLEVWLRRDRYRSQGKFTVFLFVMARSRCLNRVRDEGRRSQREQVSQEDVPGAPSQLDVLLEKERQRQVQQALLGLSVKLREAVLLRFDQGLDYAEIARIVGRSEGTVRSRVFHALKRLRRALAAQEEP